MQDKIKKLHTEHAPPLDLDAYLDDLALFNYNFNNVPINHYALLPDPMVKFIDKIPALIEKSGLNIDTEAFKEAYIVDMRQSGGYFTDIALKSDKPDPSQDQDYQNLLKALDNDLMHDEYAFHAGQFSPEPAVNARPKR